MPQEHQVLRCFSCETFQVHIVKKSKKWECKLCGEKQSLKRNYGKGSGKDCRNQVMKLNELRVLQGNNLRQVKDDETLEEPIVEELKKEKPAQSKWAEYLDEDAVSDGVESEDAADHPSETVVTKKRRRMKNNENAMKKICRDVTKSNKCSSKVWDELNSTYLTANDDFFANNYGKNKCETQPQKKNTEKSHPAETKTTLKPSKYDKYLDENDATQVSQNSNIFNSCSDDLDNLLNF